MHQSLLEIQSQLRSLIDKLRSDIQSSEPFGSASGNWSFPGLTREELVVEIHSIIEDIDQWGQAEDVGTTPLLDDYVRRLRFLFAQTIPNLWGNAALGVPAILFTLQGLRKALEPVLKRDLQGDTMEAGKALKGLASRLRAMETRYRVLEPRTGNLEAMVERIENAHAAADQLPDDLESLAEARSRVERLVQATVVDRGRVAAAANGAEADQKELARMKSEAESVLQRCERAYSASTSVGLAAAFSEKSDSLTRSMWYWVGGLAGSLVLGSYFGSSQLHSIAELFKKPPVEPWVVALNLILSFLSVAAPVWFAWLSTKQIGQRFRLAEDYAFKASISRAYEGYRKEAERIDAELAAKLLASALNRLDELPLRLIEKDSHGSPMHELASSDAVKRALSVVPRFASDVKDLATTALTTLNRSSEKTAAPSEPTKQSVP